MLIKAKELKDYTLLSKDGEIGKVKEFYFDDRHWVVRYFIIDTGTWLTDRSVLISPYAVLDVYKSMKQISVNLTNKQIEESPVLATDKPVSKQYEESFNVYYGWPAYWNGPYAWGNFPMFVKKSTKENAVNIGGKAWDPFLRSALGVQGYVINALDGQIGHVEDFIIDDENWAILYIVVDTGHGVPGKKVLISPEWIDRVSWEESKVFIKLTLSAIQNSPEYSEESLPNRKYETLLYGHYNKDGYWITKKAE